MTKDYAKPSTTRTEPAPISKKRPWKPLIALIIVLSGFAYGLYSLSQIPATDPVQQVATKKESKAPTIKAAPKKTETEKPRFTFYGDLPERVVETSNVKNYQYKDKASAKKYTYIIQAGSFRKPEDADKQRALLALQGLKSHIEAVTNAQNNIWHRVKLGPYTSRSTMNKDMDKVVSMNIQPLLIKVPVENP